MLTVDEVRLRLRRRLEELVGLEEADLLLDRPDGGWSELVTKQYLAHELDLRFTAQESKLDAKLEAKLSELNTTMHQEFRAQTWRLVTVMLGVIAAVGGIVAAIQG